jgi:hypothetical protein
MFVRALATLFLCSLAAAAIAKDNNEAMFGLRWDMSVSEVRATGAPLTQQRTEGNITAFRTESVPKGFSDAEFYVLMFASDRLVKIVMVTKDFTDDPFGTAGRERFAKIKTILEEKYGKPTMSSQEVGRKLFRERDEFYQCLAYTGCGLWAAVFEPPGKSISMELKGSRRGVGYVSITTEAEPQWTNALKQKRDSTGRSDANAL